MVEINKILTEEEKNLLLKFVNTFKEMIQKDKKIEEKNNLFLFQKLIEKKHKEKNKFCKRKNGLSN